MQRDLAKLIWDARNAAGRAIEFMSGRALDEYLANDLVRSAVERQCEIMGEALGRLRNVAPDTAERIPELKSIVGFRNVLVQGYSTIDDRLVWEIVALKLPELRAVLDGLLEGQGAHE